MRTLLLLALLAAPVPALADPAPPVVMPTDVRPIVDAMYKSMGGRDTFQHLSGLSWRFSVSQRDTVRSSRRHWWSGNRYRIEGKTRKGEEYVVLLDIPTKQGKARVNGKELSGDELKPWLDRAYALFINDMYWLAMPFKLDDDGVILVRDGEATVEGHPCDRVKVTFDHVGLTPGDTYWAYIDRESHRMIRWGFILEGDRKEDPNARETLWDWNDWHAVGPIMLSPERVQIDDPNHTIIRMGDLAAGVTFPDSVFTSLMPLAH